MDTEKIIPVVVIKALADTENTMEALRAYGIHRAEITFRTDCAEEAIRLAAEKFPDMEIGAGTVLTQAQCKRAIAAGAKFVVSPGLGKGVAKVCKKHGVPYYPGCVTPTEIMKALGLGLNIIKFFPADIYGGLKALKVLSAPFPQVRFIPTGGVNSANIDTFLAFDKVFAVGGSSFVEDALKAYAGREETNK